MARKRSVKSKRNYDPNDGESLVMMVCSTPGCGYGELAESTSQGVICSSCLMKLSMNLISEKEKLKLFGVTNGRNILSGKPRGWRWMNEFVDTKGNVYHKGVEQQELKGSRPLTDIDAIRVKQRVNKEKRMLSEEKKLLKIAAEKKEIKRAVQKQKDFLEHKVKK